VYSSYGCSVWVGNGVSVTIVAVGRTTVAVGIIGVAFVEQAAKNNKKLRSRYLLMQIIIALRRL
jgi:F0F1-type ATP synthase membrane subunit c/vacuolar-type H+-ATPase subunit K